MLGDLSVFHVAILLGVLFLVFGAGRIPAIGRALGQAISGFIGEIRGTSTATPELPPSQDTRRNEPGTGSR